MCLLICIYITALILYILWLTGTFEQSVTENIQNAQIVTNPNMVTKESNVVVLRKIIPLQAPQLNRVSETHHINADHVTAIYERFVQPKYAMLDKYKHLPLQYNNKRWQWGGKDVPRVIALLEFREFMLQNSVCFNDVLAFNGTDDPEYEYCNYNTIHNFEYMDDTVRHDLHTLSLDKRDFDFCMINQTLEHVYDPCAVIRMIYIHMKPGGIVYMNVPAMNMPHSTPYHYYAGFTPTGLGCIFQQAGFDILDIGFWGNSEYYSWILERDTWPDYTQMKSLVGERNRDAITWIFAQKPI